MRLPCYSYCASILVWRNCSMNKQTKVWLVISIALSLVIAAACGGGPTNSTTPPANTEATAAGPWSGATGTVSGVVSFNGTAPAPKKIDTSADQVCGQK